MTIAVLELDRVDEAADAGADLDLLDRLEPADEFVPVGDRSLGRRATVTAGGGGAAACVAGLSQPETLAASNSASGDDQRSG